MLAVGLLSLPLAAQQTTNSPTGTTSKRKSGIRKSPLKIANDTVVSRKMVLKEVQKEWPLEKDALVKVLNTFYTVDIRVWKEPKLKLIATVSIPEDGADGLSSDEMLTAGGISAHSFGGRMDIQVRTSLDGTYSSKKISTMVGGVRTTRTVTLYPEQNSNQNIYLPDGNTVTHSTATYNVGTGNPRLILYIPDSATLDVDNRNTAVTINEDLNDARFKLSHSSLDGRNFKKLSIQADYYTINISDVQQADLELEYGSFTAGSIRVLDLDSKGSEFDYEGGSELFLRSQNDRIIVDEVEKIGGLKLYGDLRVGKLLKELDIEGTNSDIKLRRIAASVEKVQIKDKYADLRLPLRDITDFEVSFTGSNSTVFTPFEREPGAETKELYPAVSDTKVKKDKEGTMDGHGGLTPDEFERIRKKMMTLPADQREEYLNNVIRSYDSGNASKNEPVQFRVSKGNTTGRHTVFNITCHQCSVDFK